MKKLLLFVALVAVAVAPIAAQTAKKTYKAARTPWGDPDLQGVWPSTDMVGVPLQRPSNFGERNLLTDDEFRASSGGGTERTKTTRNSTSTR
jgi:hypothetical protein